MSDQPIGANPEEGGGPAGAREERLNAVIASFLDAVAAGRTPDRRALLAEHPDLAEDLEAFFSDHDKARQVAEPWRLIGALGGEVAEPPPGERPSHPDAPTAAFVQGSSDLETPAVAADPASEAAGRRFGDYELLEEIARGGMGVVYKARQVSLNRIVALKMILAGELASETDVRRFHNEAEAAAHLDHPNIVGIYQVGEHEGRHYFSMKYVEGKHLGQIARQGVLPAKRAARYVHQVAEAIQYAHDEGVLHRDLKPSNVLIDADDQPQVTDFGLAKWTQGDSTVTVTGQVLGTPCYMSPEQVDARRHQVGPASDVYSLGAVLYELLTGRPPFRAENAYETLALVREGDLERPRRLNPQVPRDLELICLKCLERNPKHRYPSARALADDLGRYLQGDSISVDSQNLLRRVARRLTHGQHDVEFRTWSSMLYYFAGIVFLTHGVIFWLVHRGSPYSLTTMSLIRGTEFTSMGLVFWAYRRAWFPPRGAPARQLWSLWLGYVGASFVLTLVGRALVLQGHPFDELLLYPQLAILASLGFVMMGSSYWGYCYAMGVGMLLLALLMTWNLAWAPLEFGLAWGGCLVALGRHLRRLGQEA